jgi:Sec7-like guanine-nucleotide exchange factor
MSSPNGYGFRHGSRQLFTFTQGIQFLIENGFIRSKEPKDVASFLLHVDGLSKSMIGEYLGEG